MMHSNVVYSKTKETGRIRGRKEEAIKGQFATLNVKMTSGKALHFHHPNKWNTEAKRLKYLAQEYLIIAQQCSRSAVFLIVLW